MHNHIEVPQIEKEAMLKKSLGLASSCTFNAAQPQMSSYLWESSINYVTLGWEWAGLLIGDDIETGRSMGSDYWAALHWLSVIKTNGHEGQTQTSVITH